jgi:nicotinamidase-related amidase
LRASIENTACLVIDIQENLYPHMYNHHKLVKNCQKLLSGLSVLNIPIVTTEQYRKGLGPTIKQIRKRITDFDPIEKISFSCCHNDTFRKRLSDTRKRMIIICGIESHVCVLQTVIDLIELGYQPLVIEDCVSSRRKSDKNTALRRMEQERALITSSESVLFELCEKAGTEEFKAILKLVK